MLRTFFLAVSQAKRHAFRQAPELHSSIAGKAPELYTSLARNLTNFSSYVLKQRHFIMECPSFTSSEQANFSTSATNTYRLKLLQQPIYLPHLQILKQPTIFQCLSPPTTWTSPNLACLEVQWLQREGNNSLLHHLPC